MRVTARLACAPIRLYQVVFAGRPSPCRYWPTCSQYAMEAIERHGVGRGSWLAVRRVGRCHPWTPGGVDHVPGHVANQVANHGGSSA
jgi:putative membrane protein insertion efficiency factor